MHDHVTDSLTTDPKRISELTREHWENVWSHEPINNAKPDEAFNTFTKGINPDIDYSLTELMATKEIMSSKDSACGPDNMPFVAYRRCVDQVTPTFYQITRDIMDGVHHLIPEEVYLSNLFFHPKKEVYILGNAKVYSPTAVRPISVAPCSLRMVSNIARLFLEKNASTFVNRKQRWIYQGSFNQ